MYARVVIRHARGQGNIHVLGSADHEQDWQPYPVDPYSAICDDHTYIDTSLIASTWYRVWIDRKILSIFFVVN